MKLYGKSKLALVLAAIIPTFLMQTSISAADLGSKTCKMWEVLEWEIDNSSCPVSNPYDLVAKVTFTHADTGSAHTTEMFYDSSNTWKFRFTGTRTGRWTFTTASRDPELNGYKGQVTVKPNPDPKIKGFLTHKGNKFAIMDRDDTDLKPYVYQVYMNQQDYEQQYNHSSRIWDDKAL